MATNSSSRVLLMEFNKLTKEPVEGFQISLKNEDFYNWNVVIFGPPKTLYEGGYFKAEMSFPNDYPYRFNYKIKNKVTILLASHNMNEIERLCDSIIMMRKGKIIDSGTCKELVNKHGRNNLEETFLKLARSKNEF